MIIVVTGRPGIGKTTVFIKVVEEVRKQGLTVGGIVCPEVRSSGVRVGFKIVDLMSGSQGWLAYTSTNCPNALRVGKYCINVGDAISVGVKAIVDAVKNADVVCIDEIGPMELRIRELRDAIIHALESSGNVLVVVHQKLNDPKIVRLLKTAVVHEVTLGNRELLPSIIKRELLGGFKGRKSLYK